MTAQEFARVSAGRLPPSVPARQVPPRDMPSLTLMVLDALADGAETIYSMRNCGEMQPNGLALVGEAHILTALRLLLADRLVEVESEYVVADGRLHVRPPSHHPDTSDDDLRRYWFRMTAQGLKKWQAGARDLDDYWDAHPITAEKPEARQGLGRRRDAQAANRQRRSSGRA